MRMEDNNSQCKRYQNTSAGIQNSEKIIMLQISRSISEAN